MAKKDTQTLKAQLDPLLQRIEQRKDAIARERDRLRELVEDVERVLESVDEANHDLESGLRALQDGVDKLSEYL